MAATLPAINMGGDRISQSPTIQQRRIPSPPSKTGPSNSRNFVAVMQKRSQGKKEKELEQRRLHLRSQQPQLAKQQTSAYRNTYKHNLCLDMLKDGYHKSFAELFALIRQQNEERDQAGPESILWSQTLLQDQPDKLDMLKLYLTKAESAYRKESFTDVYQCRYYLAQYFLGTTDKWLSDHFFNTCLAITRAVKGDEGKLACEGHCNVGLALEESGDYLTAAENFELFHALCKDKLDWMMVEGEPMHYQASTNLTRIYTTIAGKYEEEDDLTNYLAYLEKAFDMAQGGGDKSLEGAASYRLGVAHEKNGNPKMALKYINRYLEICRSLDDNSGIGKACQAIAKSYESQGKIEESIKHLEMFVEVAEKSKDDKAISRACSDLGAMFNSLGRYDQAVEYFNKSYNISRALNDTETISSSRVLFGVAAAHKMMINYSNHIELSTRLCMERMIEWKDNRGDEFEKEIPESVPATPEREASKVDLADEDEDEEAAPQDVAAETEEAEQSESATEEAEEGEEKEQSPEPEPVQSTD